MRRTLLGLTDVDGLRRTVAVPSLPTSPAITLAAAAELACTVAHRGRAGDFGLGEAAATWFRGVAPWQAMVSWLVGGERPTAAREWSAPVFEMWAIQRGDDIVGTEWGLYQQRFKRSAEAHGFPSKLGAALSMAMSEMADNIVSHSGGARGFAAFQFADQQVAWTVVDIGRGVLASLRSSARWASRLASAQEALLAVWRDEASSRADHPKGTGFRQVEKSLAALNGQLRFRTDDAVLELSGTTGSLRPTYRSSPAMSGLQVAVSCALGAPQIFALTD
jgi:hypothetical protein